MTGRFFRKLIMTAVMATLVCAAAGISAGAVNTWRSELVKRAESYPYGLIYNSAGEPRMLLVDYSSGNTGKLRYYYKEGATWHYDDIATVDSFQEPVLVLKPNGVPAVLYRQDEGEGEVLYYAVRESAGTWAKSEIDRTASSRERIDRGYSLAIDKDGNPGISYIKDDVLYYASYEYGILKRQTLYAGIDLCCTSLCFQGNEPAIAFCAGEEGLKYVYERKNPFVSFTYWREQDIVSEDSGSLRSRYWDVTLRFVKGVPVICYHDEVARSLNFASAPNGTWSTKTVRSSTGSKNDQGDQAKMEVIESGGTSTVYLIHSNFNNNATTSIQLESLSVTSGSGLSNPSFTTQTVYSGSFSNIPPRLVSGQKNGTPSLAYFHYWNERLYHVSMEPELKTVSGLTFDALKSGESASQNITITNNGSMPLNITSIAASSAAFSLESGSAGTLAPGASRVVTVVFEPTEGGVSYHETLTIHSNDPAKPQYEIPLSGRALGNSAELSGIKLSSGQTITPSTVSNVLNVVHATESVTLTPVAAQSGAAIAVKDTVVDSGAASASIPLTVGDNPVTIAVTSEDGTDTRTYPLTITRSDSPDARLSALGVSQGTLSPAFSPEIYEYTMTLPNGESAFSFTTAATKPASAVGDSTVSINGGAVQDSYSAVVGENKYIIRVTAPDGTTTRDYTVTVLRLPELINLELDHEALSPAFSAYTTEYTATVTNGVESIYVTPSADYSTKINGAALTIDPIPLETGENTILVEVTSADGKASRQYTLSITRLPGLKSISVGDNYIPVGADEYAFTASITQAESPIYLELPAGMTAAINKSGTDILVDENGWSESLTFIEGENGAYSIMLSSPLCSESTQYWLNVTRYPTLTSLTVAGSEIEPETEIPNLIPVAGSCESAEIVMGVNEGATAVADGNSGPHPVDGKENTWRIDYLRVGANYFEIHLAAQDGTQYGYNFIILRPPVLSSITADTGALSPAFDPNVFRYTVNVGKDIEEITLSTVPMTAEGYPGTTVSINGVQNTSGETVSLNYGSNYIPVAVHMVGEVEVIESVYYVNVVRQEPSAVVSPSAGSFDQNTSAAGYGDVSVTVTAEENTLTAIRNGDAVLTADTDYTMSGGTCTIKKEYLSTLPVGQATLTFDYALGAAPVLTVSISDSTPGDGGGSGGGTTPPTPGDGGGTTPSTPSDGGSDDSDDSDTTPPAPVIAPPVTEDGAATVIAQLTPTVSGDAATSRVPASTVSSAVDAAVNAGGTEPVVQLAIQTPAQAEKVEVSLAPDSSKKLVNSGVGLTVATGVGDVSFDARTLRSILNGQENSAVTLSVETVKPDSLSPRQQALLGESAEDVVILDLNLTVGGNKVSDLGGTATISVPCADLGGRQADTMVVWFLADDGSITPCQGQYNAKTGKYEFKTGHFSAYVLVSFPFADVDANGWYYGDVAYAYRNKLMAGTSAATFTPYGVTTRGMLVTILYRMEGEPAVDGANRFADVAEGKYYTDAVIWAARENIVGGYSDTLFGPNDKITREQMAAILYRYAAYKGYDVTAAADLSAFTDSASVSGFASAGMRWANASGLILGRSDVTLDPKGNAARCQVAAILHRMMEKNGR